jgi:hypothetical protein
LGAEVVTVHDGPFLESLLAARREEPRASGSY